MHPSLVRPSFVAIVTLCSACSMRHALPERRLDRTVLTREQMVEGHYTSVYDAVAALRSNWLRPRAPDSFYFPTPIWVYIDDSRYGGVDVLRTIQPRLVNTVRFYDGPTATGRWGVDNGAGVIHVSTWSDGALGVPKPDTARRPARLQQDSTRRPR
jgi:hypothetical protein